jgi:hypothetical protein
MPDDHEMRLARHESAHAIAASVLGRSGLRATIQPVDGDDYRGCAQYAQVRISSAETDGWDYEDPWIVWPAVVRRRFEVDTIVALAGNVAELLLTPTELGRVPEPAAEAAVEAVEALAEQEPVPVLTAEDEAWAGAVFDDPALSDEEFVAQLAWLAFGRGADVEAAAFIRWMNECTKRLVGQHSATIEALAEVLVRDKTLGSEAIAGIVTGSKPWV